MDINFIILLGYFVFAIGLWYLSYSIGSNECNPKKGTTSDHNYNGGIAGIVFGSVIIVYNFFLEIKKYS